MKTLIVFSHSYFKASRANRALLSAAAEVPDVTIRNLEELYGTDPTKINVKEEQKFIDDNTRIVFQCPVFWFSTPPMLKGYIDQVFEHGWAYGSEGHHLEGKYLQLMLSTGSGQNDYQSPTIGELFLPLTTVGVFTGMKVQPIRVLYGTLGMSDEDLQKGCAAYKKLLSE